MLQRFAFILLLLWAFTFSGAPVAFAQAEDDWTEPYYSAYMAFTEWRLEDAERELRRAISMLQDEELTPDSARAACMQMLATVLMFMDRFDESARTYEDLIRAYTAAPADPDDDFDSRDYEISDLLSSIADVRIRQGDFDSAEDALERQREHDRAMWDDEEYGEVEALQRLGEVHLLQGRPALAAERLSRALQIYEDEDELHPGMSQIVYKLAEAHLRAENYAEAQRQYERTIEMMERMLGDGSEYIMSPLFKLALTLQLQERFEEAAEIYDRALRLHRTRLGNDELGALWILDNLAQMEEALGADEAAERRRAEIVAIVERKFGERSLTLADALEDHARALRAVDRDGDAERASERANGVRESVRARYRD